jgi:hypothetical protein
MVDLLLRFPGQQSKTRGVLRWPNNRAMSLSSMKSWLVAPSCAITYLVSAVPEILLKPNTSPAMENFLLVVNG